MHAKWFRYAGEGCMERQVFNIHLAQTAESFLAVRLGLTPQYNAHDHAQ
jgi:hypothetical protein